LLPAGVLDELKLNYVGCEACTCITRLTAHVVQFQPIQDTSRQQLG
jgi:hypothetical protein